MKSLSATHTKSHFSHLSLDEISAWRGALPETFMKLMGCISREDADEMMRIIDESCGRVDSE
jgi:hypothetical protein